MSDERERRDPPDEEDFPPSGDEPEGTIEGGRHGAPMIDDVDLKDLLRGALRPPPGAVAPKLLAGVQRRIRVRSRGKFYGDGWSTAESPRSTYLITALVMLAVLALVFLVLVPWSSGGVP